MRTSSTDTMCWCGDTPPAPGERRSALMSRFSGLRAARCCATPPGSSSGCPVTSRKDPISVVMFVFTCARTVGDTITSAAVEAPVNRRLGVSPASESDPSASSASSLT